MSLNSEHAVVLLLLTLILEVALAIALARFLRSRTRWSKLRVANLAASPIPLLLVAWAGYMVGFDGDGVDGQIAPAISGIIGAIILFLIGVAVVLFTVPPDPQDASDADPVADVFK